MIAGDSWFNKVREREIDIVAAKQNVFADGHAPDVRHRTPTI